MKAKERLKDFLQKAPRAEDCRYEFTLPLSESEALKYVHRMRVELSRFRTAIRQRGKQLRSFKMRIETIEPLQQASANAGPQTRVVLVFHDGNTDPLASEINDVFNTLSTGRELIDNTAPHARPLHQQEADRRNEELQRLAFGGKINVKTS